MPWNRLESMRSRMQLPRRYELTDEQWKLITPIMPRKKFGGQWDDYRTTLNGMMWIFKSGSPWRDLPDRSGTWKSVCHRFQRWTGDCTIDKDGCGASQVSLADVGDGRQGLQLSAGQGVVPEARHLGSDPPAIGSPPP